MIIYVEGMKVKCLPAEEDPFDDFAALCQWVDRQPTGSWAESPYITDGEGREIHVGVHVSVQHDKRPPETDLHALAAVASGTRYTGPVDFDAEGAKLAKALGMPYLGRKSEWAGLLAEVYKRLEAAEVKETACTDI